jgi:two-component system chemotaxis response regulator CheY
MQATDSQQSLNTTTLRALVVDDSKTIQKLVALQLTKLGHKVLGFGSDGEEGFNLFKELKPDVVFLDITMPNVDGKEGLKLILGHDPKAIVVICSALKSPELMDECLKLGAAAFIEKESLSVEGYLNSKIQAVFQHKKAA